MRQYGQRSYSTLKEVVADNLRRLCENDGRSIAYICRAMQISRSQFDRYLLAENLPTEGTAKTIANFFRIAEVDLFQVGFRANINMPTEFEDGIRNMTHLPPPRFPHGIYFLLTTLVSDPRKIMCGVVIIKPIGENLGFIRLSGYSKKRYRTGTYFRARHAGIVVERYKWLYFTAVNMVPEYEPSMLMFRWIMGDGNILSGTASVVTENGPDVIDAVLQRAPADLSLRQAVRLARAHPKRAAFIDDEVKCMLDQSSL